MKRISLLLIGALMLSAPLAMTGPSAGASTTRRDAVPGTYLLYGNWEHIGWSVLGTVTLGRHHSGTDQYGDNVAWSVVGKTITLKVTNSDPGLLVTYIGTRNRTGISTLSNPGTDTTTQSTGSGEWYAVRTG